MVALPVITTLIEISFIISQPVRVFNHLNSVSCSTHSPSPWQQRSQQSPCCGVLCGEVCAKANWAPKDGQWGTFEEQTSRQTEVTVLGPSLGAAKQPLTQEGLCGLFSMTW